MSRRPDNKAAQNQQTIKSLLKLEANKVCADCKKNKHPRWASWNLGVFLCIRCSGIHRGMGTHISRVKSVELDAWTDEQLQSILRWGNARANKYWEAKLTPGHVPSEAKIENFIRTKYESKRWVMDGPMPDPSTLGDDGDDNVPLNVVRDKAQLDRSASQRGTAISSGPPSASGTRRQPTESFDLIGADDPVPPPPRPSTTDTPSGAAGAPPPKSSTSSQLLGGLDFLGDTPERPSSAGQKPGGMSRPDLKQSILSLYAAQPKPSPQSPPSQSSHERQSSFGAMGSPQNTSSSGFGGMNDAFASLSFGSTSNPPRSAQPQQPSSASSFGGLGQMSPPAKANPAPPQMTSPPLSGGGFFDAGPKPPPKPNAPKASAGASLAVRKTSNASDGFGDFTSGTTTSPPTTSTNKNSSNSGLLDFTQTMVNIQPVVANKPASPTTNSPFNLSQQKQASTQPTAPTGQANYASKMSSDPWGANEWATPDPAPAPRQTPASNPPTKSGGGDFGWGPSGISGTSGLSNEWGQRSTTSNLGGSSTGGWGSDAGFASRSGSGAFNPPKVTAEEDFGGWGSSTTQPGPATQNTSSNAPKPFTGGTDDLFSNVWG